MHPYTHWQIIKCTTDISMKWGAITKLNCQKLRDFVVQCFWFNWCFSNPLFPCFRVPVHPYDRSHGEESAKRKVFCETSQVVSQTDKIHFFLWMPLFILVVKPRNRRWSTCSSWLNQDESVVHPRFHPMFYGWIAKIKVNQSY